MKTKIEEAIVSLIEKMESNTFLMPQSWSDEIQMSEHDWKYKTYVGSRGSGRYINVEIMFADKKKYLFQIVGKSVNITRDISDNVTTKKLLFYIEEIYKEKHSFKSHSEGTMAIRKKIADRLGNISVLKKEVQDLRVQLLDSKFKD